MTSNGRRGVSFVVPVHNGSVCVRETLEAIFSQDDGRPMEVIAVDDNSDDGSSALLARLATVWPLRIVTGPGRGAAAAINHGVRMARHPVICQVDQDVVVKAGWMRALVDELDDPAVAAVQGYYATDPEAGLCARVMGLDLEQRYAAIEGRSTGHVCTGNVAYRAAALHRVGLFDESLGYGYDNDMSYRLKSAGYRLVFCREARSFHRWREGLVPYLVQQYGFGYGRLDIVARHPAYVTGDSVSGRAMMAHPFLLAMAMLLLALPMVLAAGSLSVAGVAGWTIVGGLLTERLVAGVRAARQFKDRAALLFAPVHLARDLSWVVAIVVWLARRAIRRPGLPSHSMRPRRNETPALERPGERLDIPLSARIRPGRILGLIPAYNEGANLAAVVAELRGCRPDLDILIVDDGSTDATPWLLEHMDVQWLRFPERLGIGCAMRAGLRYAARMGYDAAVRLDGDGQHRAEDIERLLVPIQEGSTDVVLGSRYAETVVAPPLKRLLLRVLAGCLSALTGTRVTDPTSGFCAIGPRALGVLAVHHPTGYPEPELRLFLSRNALTVCEVSVRARARFGGQTTLTAGRLTAAGARVLLAMIIVPLRCRVEGRP